MQDFSRYLQSRVCPSAHVGAYSKSWSLKTWSQPTLKPKFEAAQFQWLALSWHCEVSHSFESTLWKDRSVDISAELRPNLNSFAAFAVHSSFEQSRSFWRLSSPLYDLDLVLSIFPNIFVAKANKIFHRQCLVIAIVCLYCLHLLIQLRCFANYPENRSRFTRLFPPAVWLRGCAWYFARKVLQISSPAL